jgi:hypothetical protein
VTGIAPVPRSLSTWQVECPLRSAGDNRMVYDMLWSDPATAEQVRFPADTPPRATEHGGFSVSCYYCHVCSPACWCWGEVLGWRGRLSS